jgi:hypothetical protein
MPANPELPPAALQHVDFTPAARAPRRQPPKDHPDPEANPNEFLPEEVVLDRLGAGAKYCQDVEQQLARFVTPELETIMKLHRVIILKLSTQAEARPELWDVLKDLMKPVMDWARLQEQSKEREFAEQKYRDQAKKAEALEHKEDAALSPETLEKIEFELRLL